MSGHSFSLDHEYQTQSLEWIKSLTIKEISDKNCALFIWAVNPLLPEAFEIIKAWGFKYKTVAFCWNKKYTNGGDVSNLGRWTMGNVELCLLATKGSPKRITKNVKQLVSNFRTKHSAKPPEVRQRIVELMGDLPRIELFARKEFTLMPLADWAGWDAIGNGIDGQDIKITLEKMVK